MKTSALKMVWQMVENKTLFEKNSQDLSQLHKKYFIQTKKSFLAKKVKKLRAKTIPSLLGNKKRTINQEILNHIDKNFLSVFDQESYLLANVDLQKALENGQYDTPLEHFILFGYSEIKEGARRIGTLFPFMSEKEYLDNNDDLKRASKEGTLANVFNHFLSWGYKEMIDGRRSFTGSYQFNWNAAFKEQFIPLFDAPSYLEANSDVLELIEKKKFKDAWNHFDKVGVEEVRQGKRSIHPNIPKQYEGDYMQSNPDILFAMKKGEMLSGFEHFLLFGLSEMLSGSRLISGIKVYSYDIPVFTETVKKALQNFKRKPLISVIMPVYNVDAKWLQLAIDSLNAQWYPHWELCISDDASSKKETIDFLNNLDDPNIKIIFLKENVNISGASNAALKLATGDYIALMDNDDELTPDALYEVVKTINDQDADFIYSDEDKIEMDGQFTDPHFKPDYAPDMFLSQNYISHLGVIKKSLIDEVGAWTVGLEGSQDYDLYLRVLEKTDKIVHIPKVLYHWRKIPGSTAAEFSDKSYAQEAGLKALEQAMERRNIAAKVENAKYPGTYRVKYNIVEEPLVSIVIPFKDKPELLDMCINSVMDRSTYQNYEIIGMSNNSEEAETFEMMEKLSAKDKRVKFYEYNEPFNYSAINNYAVTHYSKGEHIILLNNDIEIISSEWIEALLEFSQRENVGAVGAKLYYPNDTIQHAGVIIGIGGVGGHSHKYFDRTDIGYFSRLNLVQNVSAVTAACLMVKKTIFEEMNGLNEEDLKIAFNDVDFCLRLGEAGYQNIYTPYCEAYHHESISRGEEDNPEKVKRFNTEVKYMKKRHANILEMGDPYYNKNLTLENESFEYQQKDSVQ